MLYLVLQTATVVFVKTDSTHNISWQNNLAQHRYHHHRHDPFFLSFFLSYYYKLMNELINK